MPSNYHTKTLCSRAFQKSEERNDILSLPCSCGFLISGVFAKNSTALAWMIAAPAVNWLNHRTDMVFSPDQEINFMIHNKDNCITN
jgi:hypothetical protein